MDALILYLAKASGLVAVFFIAYWLLLKKETFFSANRWFLLAGLLTAALLPLAEYTKVVWVAAKPVTTLIINAQDLKMLQGYTATATATVTTIPTVAPQPEITWQDIALGVYIIGALLFLARFLTDVSFIKELLGAYKSQKHGRFRLIDSPQVQSPFSFFNYIVYNSAVLTAQELESILEHEKVHSRQRHSLDMIIGQLFCVVLWFNPFVWFYKKAIAQNLEFIADKGAAQRVTDTVGYQKTLLKITLQPECIAITNHFYQSLIKKRIVMLNKQKSSRRSSWKYGVVLPALAAFVLVFQVKVVAQEKQQEPVNTVKADVLITHGQGNNNLVITINKDTKDSELEERKKTVKNEFDADVVFSNLKRNSKSEITAIKVAFTGKNNNNMYEVKGNQPIKPFTIVMAGEGKNDYTIDFGKPENVAAIYPCDTNNDTIIFSTKQYLHSPPAPQAPVIPQSYAFTAPQPSVFAMPLPVAATSRGVSLNFGDSDALVVINGVKYAKGQEIKLPAGHQVTSLTTLGDKEGKDKYGKEGKRGVIVITSTPATLHISESDLPENARFGYAATHYLGQPLAISDMPTLADTFPFEIFEGVSFNEGGFSGLSLEKQKEIADKLEAFNNERNHMLEQRDRLRGKLEINRNEIEMERAEKQKMRAEKQKKRGSEQNERNKEIENNNELKRKIELERKAKADKGKH